MGYDAAYIKRYVNLALESSTDSFRNEVLNTVLNIVRSCDEKDSAN